jgi:hypothetical protein
MKKMNKRATYPELEALYWQLSPMATKREQALLLFAMGKDPSGGGVAREFALPTPTPAPTPAPTPLQLSMDDDEPAV